MPCPSGYDRMWRARPCSQWRGRGGAGPVCRHCSSIPSAAAEPFPLRPLRGETLPAPLCGAGNGPSDSSQSEHESGSGNGLKKKRGREGVRSSPKSFTKDNCMAISRHHHPDHGGSVRNRARTAVRFKEIVADTQETGVPGMLAAVMEADAAYIEDALGALSGWDRRARMSAWYPSAVRTNWRSKGYRLLPEHKPRKCGAACFGETPNPLD